MPKIYEYLGLIFFFYANEHLPIHVHVSSGGLESKLELVFEKGRLKEVRPVQVKGKRPLTNNDLKEAIRFAKKHSEGIVEKWTSFFVKNKKVSCEVISKKI